MNIYNLSTDERIVYEALSIKDYLLPCEIRSSIISYVSALTGIKSNTNEVFTAPLLETYSGSQEYRVTRFNYYILAVNNTSNILNCLVKKGFARRKLITPKEFNNFGIKLVMPVIAFKRIP